MMTQLIAGMILIMGCIYGVMFALIGRDGGDSDAQTLSRVIAILCVLLIVVDAKGICIICTHGSYFGVVMQSRTRAILVTDNANMGIFNNSLAGATAGNNTQLETLKAQNKLLQQQLQLQQQMMLNRNQQTPRQQHLNQYETVF